MTSIGKKISIEDLRVGMYVADVYNAKEILLYSARTLITNKHQIDYLKKQGVTSVFVVSDEPTVPSGEAEERNAEADSGHEEEIPGESIIAHANYRQQLREAGELRENVLGTVRDTMKAAKAGKMFSCRSVIQATERLTEKVLGDPHVYFGLMQIKTISDFAYIHSVNVSIMAAAFASALNYPDDQILDIAIGSMLHDIGKMKIPESLWLKNGYGTRSEFEIFKQHPGLGVEILENNHQRISAVTKAVVAQHHENWNGGGYPQGICGTAISEAAMLCTLADRYDLLTMKTPYHNSCIPQEALALIYQGVDSDFPRMLVEQFTKLLGIYPVGSFVALKSGEKGLVIRINRSSLLTPVVLILFNEKGKRLETPFVRDLSSGISRRTDYLGYKIEGSLDPAAYFIYPAHYFNVAAG